IQDLSAVRVWIASSLRSSQRRELSRLLIERLEQGDVALLLLTPVTTASDSAVDHEIMTVDEARLVARQEHCRMRDVVGQAGTRDRLRRLVDVAHHRRRLFG